MKISKKILSMIMVLLLIVGIVPVSAVAEDTGETYTLTIKYAVEDTDGTTIGTEIEDMVITGITPGTVIDLSDYWPDTMSVTGSDGRTYYFLNHSTYSDNRHSYSGALFYWVADKNDVIYAFYEDWHTPYELTLDPSGGKVNCQKILCLSSSLLELSNEDQLVPVRDGYRFLGWSLDKNELSDQYVVVEDSGTLYAIWEKLPSVQVGKATLYDGEYTTDGQSTTTTKPESGGYAHFENGVLTLNNFTYSGGGIDDDQMDKGVIVSQRDIDICVVGDNTVQTDEYIAFVLRGKINICGGGSLSIKNNAEYGVHGYAIEAQTSSVTIQNVTLEINSEANGIKATGLTIKGVTANIRAKQNGYCLWGSSAEITDSTVVLTSENSSAVFMAVSTKIDGSDITAEGKSALTVNTGGIITLSDGTYKLTGTSDDSAIYVEGSTLTLPTITYWWRTNADGAFTENDFVYDKQNYIEITTTQPHICVWDTEWSSDENAHWRECLTAGCPISDNAQKDGYGLHNPNTDDGDCSTAVTCAVCKAVTTAAKSHSFTELSTQIASEGDCQNPKTYYAKCANCDEISDTVNVASSEYGNHKWDTKWTTDGEKHWRKCLNTDCTEVGGDSFHSGGTATCKDKAKCEVCDVAYGDTDGDNHSYSADLTWTGDEHFYECSLCSAKKDKALHDFTDGCDETCNTCEYVRVITHAFNKMEKDTDGHWCICSVCGVEAPEGKEAHKGGTATCEAKAKCEVCETEYGKLLDHKYEWVIDKEPTATEEGSKHEECTVCKAKRNENTAIPKTETNSPQTGDNSNMALWLALLFIGGMGVVATTVYGRKRRAN